MSQNPSILTQPGAQSSALLNPSFSQIQVTDKQSAQLPPAQQQQPQPQPQQQQPTIRDLVFDSEFESANLFSAHKVRGRGSREFIQIACKPPCFFVELLFQFLLYWSVAFAKKLPMIMCRKGERQRVRPGAPKRHKFKGQHAVVLFSSVRYNKECHGQVQYHKHGTA